MGRTTPGFVGAAFGRPHSYGDYAGLNGLGITPNNANIYQAALAAAGRVTPVGSGSSGTRKTAGKVTNAKKEDGSKNLASFDFDEDEGIFTWNGRRYGSLSDLEKAINAVGLTSGQKTELKRKLKAYGFSVKLA